MDDLAKASDPSVAKVTLRLEAITLPIAVPWDFLPVGERFELQYLHPWSYS